MALMAVLESDHRAFLVAHWRYPVVKDVAKHAILKALPHSHFQQQIKMTIVSILVCCIYA